MSRLPVASSSAASTGSSEAATVSDGMSTDCCVCLEDIYNDKDVAALIPCGMFICLFLNSVEKITLSPNMLGYLKPS